MSMLELNGLRVQYGGKLVRSIFTFSDNLATYLFSKKPRKGPLFVGWDIASKCNARCAYCKRWRPKDRVDSELSTKQVLKIIRELGKLKVWLVSFCGGEPLLRSDLGVIIKEAKKQGLNVNITTNGTLLEKNAETLISSNVDSIIVSVAGYKPEQHDSVSGLKGSFECLTSGIKKLKKLRQGNSPNIGVRLVVNKKTSHELDDYIRYWRSRVDKVILQPIHNDPSIGFIAPPGMAYRQEDKKDFTNNFMAVLKKHKFLSNIYYKEFPTFFFNRRELAKKYPCLAGFFYIEIDAQGNVYPCGGHVKNLGNLAKQSFIDIWQGERLNQFRKIIRAKQNKCICWYNCSMLNAYLSKLIRFIPFG